MMRIFLLLVCLLVGMGWGATYYVNPTIGSVIYDGTSATLTRLNFTNGVAATYEELLGQTLSQGSAECTILSITTTSGTWGSDAAGYAVVQDPGVVGFAAAVAQVNSANCFTITTGVGPEVTLGAAYADASTTGDIVQLADGTYDLDNETVTADYLHVNGTRSITFQGNAANRAAVTIAGKTGVSFAIRSSTQQGFTTTFKDMTITGSQASGIFYIDTNATADHSIALNNCVLTNTASARTVYNTVTSSSAARRTVSIINCSFTSASDGASIILAGFGDNTVITGNTFAGGSAITFKNDAGTGFSIKNNTFTSVGAGCIVGSQLSSMITNAVISGNTINSSAPGIRLPKYFTNLLIEDNAINESTTNMAIQVGEDGPYGNTMLTDCTIDNETYDIITLNVAPATAWVATDVITGQASAQTCTVLAQIDTYHYIVSGLGAGAWQDNEIVGVTGTPAKLADQAAGCPAFGVCTTVTKTGYFVSTLYPWYAGDKIYVSGGTGITPALLYADRQTDNVMYLRGDAGDSGAATDGVVFMVSREMGIINAVIRNNHIANTATGGSGGHAILIGGGADGTSCVNNVINAGTGTGTLAMGLVVKAENCQIENNTIRGRFGLRLKGGGGNKIYNNTIITTSQQAVYIDTDPASAVGVAIAPAYYNIIERNIIDASGGNDCIYTACFGAGLGHLYTRCDYNCYVPGAASLFHDSTAIYEAETLAELLGETGWPAYTNFIYSDTNDTHSLQANPGLVLQSDGTYKVHSPTVLRLGAGAGLEHKEPSRSLISTQ